MATRLGNILKAKIEKAIKERSSDLAFGGAKDYPDYKFHVGWLCGISAALDLCEEAEREHE
jgi:hypothetical protein